MLHSIALTVGHSSILIRYFSLGTGAQKLVFANDLRLLSSTRPMNQTKVAKLPLLSFFATSQVLPMSSSRLA